MGFMGSMFRALGFEGEGKAKTAKKEKGKASYSLKKQKTKRVDQIDGVPVYYPEDFEQIKNFVDFVKNGKAIIVSVEACDKDCGERILTFLEGFAFGVNARQIELNANKLYLILPEGMEVEE